MEYVEYSEYWEYKEYMEYKEYRECRIYWENREYKECCVICLGTVILITTRHSNSPTAELWKAVSDGRCFRYSQLMRRILPGSPPHRWILFPDSGRHIGGPPLTCTRLQGRMVGQPPIQVLSIH